MNIEITHFISKLNARFAIHQYQEKAVQKWRMILSFECQILNSVGKIVNLEVAHCKLSIIRQFTVVETGFIREINKGISFSTVCRVSVWKPVEGVDIRTP